MVDRGLEGVSGRAHLTVHLQTEPAALWGAASVPIEVVGGQRDGSVRVGGFLCSGESPPTGPSTSGRREPGGDRGYVVR